jgi:hypothetical protein
MKSYGPALIGLLLLIMGTMVYARSVTLRLLEVIPNPSTYEFDLTMLIISFGAVTLAIAFGLGWLLLKLTDLSEKIVGIRSAVDSIELKLTYESRVRELEGEIARLKEEFSHQRT